jgi:hypothetical protein
VVKVGSSHRHEPLNGWIELHTYHHLLLVLEMMNCHYDCAPWAYLWIMMYI